MIYIYLTLFIFLIQFKLAFWSHSSMKPGCASFRIELNSSLIPETKLYLNWGSKQVAELQL